MDNVVIAGAGLAGFSVARRLRELNFSGNIALYGDEGVLPYDRPPLSKKYLTGAFGAASLLLRSREYYEQQGIQVRSNQPILEIDRARERVLFEGGDAPYDALVLATGAEARKLPAEMTRGLSGVFTLRNLIDADSIFQTFAKAQSVAIIGGGYLGLEIAATAAQRGLHVTIIEAASRLLQRVAGHPTADYIRKLHQANGVIVREGVKPDRFRGLDAVEGVLLSDGSEVAADCVVVGVGITPRTELANAAGLAVANGIVTDSMCRTSDPKIWAAGDCASFPMGGRQVRLESVGNAIEMAECVAENIMGTDREYVARPWFWSDQYDTCLQIVGLGHEHDVIVVRGGGSDQALSHWYFGGDKLLAADVINDPKTYMIAKRLIESGRSPTRQMIGDATTNLKALIKG
ncbi:3-phenylpropionate/trans-cinnamate dioxygenase ferredoxin reductase subunit [Bradyrhizobium sp. USDA 4524]|uniref:NAD(P)/FAD-dependent oxidoreductase n=1 Tax=unclassified Bradyrhizobium TaxID=2631580 RepID=UPI00209FBB56|nr:MULTISPECIES: FAD-dependent oxidoreductase [unclassified Bradyrhizobium]MCP1838652.1 3-phenylpropionate/trans-cinnamate dioxygenase ferredoxin reductase subunit [Bradyrhizobium sp. USDA 4538]MCP1899218.1 3-phenylpropionate/trans-cinnamate dioxygenase ferredoxin reductase subunit [Bradyrhizobium sp. USDA 4537]MCP1986670.1 3-phenylpropionate/trans-cinnamate dioxygenase ferredoxin reductase subunit [Bradyrhizobium sp. USDA 4539]